MTVLRRNALAILRHKAKRPGLARDGRRWEFVACFENSSNLLLNSLAASDNELQ